MMNDLTGKRLLVLGGTRISCEIVRKAHEMGVFVGVTDYNVPEQSPGKQIADASYMVSTTDVDGVVDLIRDEKMDGVLVGFNDMLLPFYADICDKSGLPCYGTKKQFVMFTDKKQYKQLLRQYKVPTIEEYSVSDALDEDKHTFIHFPVIVKPAGGSGARGISICRNKKELIQACELSGATSDEDGVVIEQYVDEKEATAFWVFQDGEYYVSAVGNRHVKHNQEGVIPLPAGYTFPASVTGEFLSEVAPNARKMFQAAGIRNGMMFMQCKVKDGQCLVYDIGYRLTGSLEYKILHEACGYDPLEMMIRFALTGHMAEENIADKVNPYLGRYCYNVSRLCAPGKIAAITGREEALKYPGVLDVVTAHFPGETITQEMKGLLAQITVRVLGISTSLEDLYKDIQHVQGLIKIISDEGEDLSLEGVEETDLDGALSDIFST